MKKMASILKLWEKNKRTPLKGEIELGAFYPSLFCMKFGTDKELLNSDEEYILFHEYIHFLQDVSTNFGKMNICNFYNKVRQIANIIYKHKDEKVKIPIDLPTDEYFESIQKATEILRGNTSNIPRGSKSGKFGNEVIKFKAGNIKAYFLEIKNKKYYIGSDDIIENMAYLLERIIYGDNSPAPIYPYKTIEILTEQLLPDLCENLVLIIGLCELSLISSNPAQFYFESIDRIHKNNLKVERLDDLIQLINNNFSMDYMGEFITPIEAVKKTTEDAIKFLTDPFKADHFKDVKEWVTSVMINAQIKRLGDPLFITRGLLVPNPRNYFLGLLTAEIGFPPIMNRSQEIFMKDSSPKNLFLFLTFIEFWEIFQYGKKGCGLYKGCVGKMKYDKESHKVSAECKTAPWKKCNDYKLCPLSTLLKTWGLNSINYQYQKK